MFEERQRVEGEQRRGDQTEPSAGQWVEGLEGLGRLWLLLGVKLESPQDLEVSGSKTAVQASGPVSFPHPPAAEPCLSGP